VYDTAYIETQSSVYPYLLYVLYVSSFNAACLQYTTYLRIHLVCRCGIVVPARLKTVNTMLDGLDRKDRKQSSANKKESSIKQHLAFDVPADVDRSMLDDSTDDGSRRERVVPDE